MPSAGSPPAPARPPTRLPEAGVGQQRGRQLDQALQLREQEEAAKQGVGQAKQREKGLHRRHQPLAGRALQATQGPGGGAAGLRRWRCALQGAEVNAAGVWWVACTSAF